LKKSASGFTIFIATICKPALSNLPIISQITDLPTASGFKTTKVL